MISRRPSRGSSYPVSRMVEEIIRCKWSLAILDLIRSGTTRPGAIRRSLNGLSTKVMNERLTKMVRFGILTKRTFPEVPPRVEYGLTAFGRRFLGILDQIAALQAELGAEVGGSKGMVENGENRPTGGSSPG